MARLHRLWSCGLLIRPGAEPATCSQMFLSARVFRSVLSHRGRGHSLDLPACNVDSRGHEPLRWRGSMPAEGRQEGSEASV
eukprot:9120345-Lingulodinium_polyedra.AAC.1